MEVVILTFAFLFGLAWGSFLNVVIYRVPEGVSLLKPRSFCPVCGKKIKWYDNIPILSYIILRGRCRYCGAKIPLRYPLIEFWTGLTFVFIWKNFSAFPLEMIKGFVFTTLLIVLAGIDSWKMLLPDIFTLPGIAAGVAFSFFLTPGPKSAILGAVLGYISLWLVYKIFLFLTGKEGMGYGDFKMFAMIGAFMGVKQLIPVILVSSLAGVLVGLGIMIFRTRGGEVLL